MHDIFIIIKEKDNICTSDFQFGFKQGSFTSLCNAMVQEIISYYVHNSNVYGLMLDASEAFDIINYWKFLDVKIRVSTRKKIIYE